VPKGKLSFSVEALYIFVSILFHKVSLSVVLKLTRNFSHLINNSAIVQ
jgi:hypothetical protein